MIFSAVLNIYLTIFWLHAIVVTAQDELNFDDVKSNKRARGKVILKFSTNIVSHCLYESMKVYPRCRSANFHFEKRICELLEVSCGARKLQFEDADGWIYYGQTFTDDMDVVTDTCIQLTKERKPEKGNLVHILPAHYQTWSLEFEIIPLAIVYDGEYKNVLHFTIGGSGKEYGERVPAMWFRPNSSIPYICSEQQDREVEWCINDYKNPLPLNQYSRIKIEQKETDPETVMCNVIINDTEEYSISYAKQKIFKNVRVYMSNPFEDSANCKIKNLVFETKP